MSRPPLLIAGHFAGWWLRDSVRFRPLSQTVRWLLRLAELYREARFSGHPIGADLRADARRELAVLRADLCGAPRGPAVVLRRARK